MGFLDKIVDVLGFVEREERRLWRISAQCV